MAKAKTLKQVQDKYKIVDLKEESETMESDREYWLEHTKKYLVDDFMREFESFFENAKIKIVKRTSKWKKDNSNKKAWTETIYIYKGIEYPFWAIKQVILEQLAARIKESKVHNQFLTPLRRIKKRKKNK